MQGLGLNQESVIEVYVTLAGGKTTITTVESSFRLTTMIRT
jgi:hypothetical protein